MAADDGDQAARGPPDQLGARRSIPWLKAPSKADVCIVVDCGAYSVKAGHCSVDYQAHDAAPHTTRRSEQREVADLPWAELLHAWQPSDHAMVLSVPLTTAPRELDRLSQVMFEELKVPKLFIGSSAFTASLAEGLRNGVLVDIGETSAYAVSVAESRPLRHTLMAGGLGGSQLSDAMARMMESSGYMFPAHVDRREVGRMAKEKLAYVAPCFATEMQRKAASGGGLVSAPSCSIRGGSRFRAARGEDFACGELLFEPSQFGHLFGEAASPSFRGLQELAISTARLSAPSPKEDKHRSILVAGASSLIPGISERLWREVKGNEVWPAGVQVRLPDARRAETLAWHGGADLVRTRVARESHLVSRADYEAQGSSCMQLRFV